MKKEKWNDLKKAWLKFKNDVDKSFDKEVKMTVFAYNIFSIITTPAEEATSKAHHDGIGTLEHGNH